MRQQRRPHSNSPVWHIVMGLAGWILYLFAPYWPILVLAISLSFLALPRFIRGPWEKADTQVDHRLNEPALASKRVSHILTDGETLLWETHDHPIRMLWWTVAGVALTMAMAVVAFQWSWVIAGTLWVVGALYILARTVLWQRDRLCLTDKRIFVVRGLLKVRHEFMPLNKLTNEKLQIPWHSNVLSWLRLVKVQYGTLVVDAAGDEDELKNVKFIPYAIQLNRIIMEKALG